MVDTNALKQYFGVGSLEEIASEAPSSPSNRSFLRQVITYAWNNRKKLGKLALVAGGATLTTMALVKYNRKNGEVSTFDALNNMPRDYKGLPEVAEMPAMAAVPDAFEREYALEK